MEVTKESVVRLHHTIDDLEKDRHRGKRAAYDAYRLLVDAQRALADGRLEIVEEFLDRAVDGLKEGFGTKVMRSPR